MLLLVCRVDAVQKSGRLKVVVNWDAAVQYQGTTLNQLGTYNSGFPGISCVLLASHFRTEQL